MPEIYPFGGVPFGDDVHIHAYATGDGADGGELTLSWGGQTIESSGELVEASDDPEYDYQYFDGGGAYVYHWVLEDTNPSTAYSIDIADEWSGKIRTLPKSGRVDVAAISDIHPDYVMEAPEPLHTLAGYNPDVLCIVGDVITGSFNQDPEHADEWVWFLRDYFQRFNHRRIPFVCPVPGNHDVGNSSFDGTDSDVEPGAGYFQTHFPEIGDSEPTGENYYSLHLTDDFQLVGLDTHSAYADDVGPWLSGAIDTDAEHVLAIHHSPMLPGGDRSTDDLHLAYYVASHVGQHLFDADNCEVSICGHTHVDNEAHWTLIDDEPTNGTDVLADPAASRDDPTEPYIPTEDGRYIVAGDDMIQIGDGFGDNRDLIDMEWTERTDQRRQATIIRRRSDRMDVRVQRTNGSVVTHHTIGDGDLPSADVRDATIRGGTLGQQ